MEVIKPPPVQEPLKVENAGGDGAVKLSKTQKRNLKRKLKLKAMKRSSVQEQPLEGENAKLSKYLKKKLKAMEASSVQEQPLKVENAGANVAVKLSKAQKKALNTKIFDAKSPESIEFNRTSRTPLQNNPNSNLGTRKPVKLKEYNTRLQKRKREELKNVTPSSSGDKISVHESTKDVVTVNKDSIATATNDAKMVSKGAKDQTKDTNGKMVLLKSKNHNKDGTRKKKKMHRSTDIRPTLGEILNPQYFELFGRGFAKIAARQQNKKIQKVQKQEVTNEAINLERSEDQTTKEKVETTRTMEPISGDILNPRKLEEHVITEEKRESSKEMSNKRNREETQPTDLKADEKSKVKARIDDIARDDIARDAKLRNKLLIFDINGLLADIVSPRPKDMKADKYIRKRSVFKRPFLDDFLRFCFEKFIVGIWSSRTKQVLDPVVDFLFGDFKKNLLFIWNNSNCTSTGMKTLEDRHKPIVLKDLRKIWLKNGPNNSWVKGTFHESNTLLLDDTPYKALLNPKYTGIFPESYTYKDRNDDVLSPNGALRTYLEGLAESNDVKTYVQQHPFGQRAIDQKHQHWNFYIKVLRCQI